MRASHEGGRTWPRPRRAHAHPERLLPAPGELALDDGEGAVAVVTSPAALRSPATGRDLLTGAGRVARALVLA